MGKTLAEKIIGEHAKREVKAGEIVIVPVDVCLTQDGTGPLAIRQLQKIDLEHAKNPQKTVLFLDHAAPSPRKELSNDHMLIREFAQKTGACLSDVGKGVCHQIIAESYLKPGDILIGADSHTCTGGGLGAFATGMGSTDVGMGIALGKTWLRVPETFKIEVTGKFQKGVYPKDLILYLIGLIGADGATYKALEWCGDTIDRMSQSGRLCLANMAVEAGAKAGLFATDDTTREYLEEHKRKKDFRKIDLDNDAEYEREIKIDASQLVPTISFPHTVDNTKRIDDINESIKIDQVFVGTCTNGRLEDLKAALKVIKGKKKHPRVRMIVVPASKKVFLDSLEKGYIKEFIEFGAAILAPGCGPCVGVHEGILGDGERCLATMNRNFKGRMGNPEGFIYLASPATAAAAAITGEISDPREFLIKK
ncbi:MAG: 3-isopropylmalate dehydratase large subunit [candidate division Zixibacteria bacterium SM23_73_2]|nr:MAG: 3-isopropylmalate dehydratase large subunit [candidate division Zixibacteria bacterium SM23_73_2]